MDVTKPPKKFEIKFLITTGIPLILLVAAALVLYMVGYPKYKQLPEKKDELNKLTQKEAALQTKIKKLDTFMDYKDIITENSNLVNFALPSEAQVPLLLTQVQLIANESGLKINSLSYSASSAKATGDETDVVNVQLSVKGTFNETKTFLTTLEKAARVVNISTLRFSLVEGTNPESLGTSELDITFSLTSPFLFVESKAVTEDPITVDLNDSKFVTFINKLKGLKIYKTVVDTSNIGKENPFTQTP